MFKSIIQIVERIDEPSKVREVLRLTLPEVNQAMASVEGMIQDVMQIGSDAKMNMEDMAPEALIEAALGELFRIFPAADVTFSYEFGHFHMVRADSLRLGRVFANILGNAVQAMEEKGCLWFRTTERDGLITFTLGNSGSFIPAESLTKLFDAFFTSGKKGGTGLGLAIAKKIIEAHGGTILCVSEMTMEHPSGLVEFVFTLPAADSVSHQRIDPLPRSSLEIQAALAAVRITSARQSDTGPDPREAEIESHVVARLEALGVMQASPLTILMVEDEAVYCNGVRALLAQPEAIAARIRLVLAKDDSEALAALHEHKPVLVIEDVDLGPRSKDGIEIVRAMREQGFAGHICVHSNRFLERDIRVLLDAGADNVLPKPLTRTHFLKLLLVSLPSAPTGEVMHAIAPEASTVPTASQPRKLAVAMLDDSVAMRMAWKLELEGETNFRPFGSTTDFFDACEKDPSYLVTLDVVVTDYNFAPGDPHDGGSFARALRAIGFQGLILRASGQLDLDAEIEALFDGDVGKGALEWPEFRVAVETARTRRT